MGSIKFDPSFLTDERVLRWGRFRRVWVLVLLDLVLIKRTVGMRVRGEFQMQRWVNL